MIDPTQFFQLLNEHSFNFYVGVPDSLLKNLCACIEERTAKRDHIIAANEGNAVAIAAGHHLATGRTPVVYMQNSGLGNCINPLTSLTHPEVYRIPMLLLIGWRGEPGLHDEPQHLVQGRITTDQLKLLGIDFYELDSNSNADSILSKCVKRIKQRKSPVAILIKKKTFLCYKPKKRTPYIYNFSREQAIRQIIELSTTKDLLLSTTGKCSRELHLIRQERGETISDFLTVGSMGHTSSIALGVALGVSKKVICLDGDGAALMHLGALPIVGAAAPQNFLHIILNNGAHESVGGQPTVGREINFEKLADAFNYKNCFSIEKSDELDRRWSKIYSTAGPTMLILNIDSSSKETLPRPDCSPEENKTNFMCSAKRD
jgi:phosphonopyruvate decarboxylase